MEEAAEAQERVCDIHYKQMDKADRDPLHAVRAEEECRQLLLQYPNSKFAPETQQKLRNAQEVLAAHEYAAAVFYHHKGAMPAAANRLTSMVDQYPLFRSRLAAGGAHRNGAARSGRGGSTAHQHRCPDPCFSPPGDSLWRLLGLRDRSLTVAALIGTAMRQSEPRP